MASLKIPNSEIKQAILSVEDDFLSLETLKALRLFSPSPEEIKTMNSFTGDISQLASSDKYFFNIKDIPRLQSRICSMIYRRKFENEIEELDPEMKVLQVATKEIHQSKKLKTLLLYVLEIGNVLNFNTYRGKAVAFEISALLKLKETKSNKGSGNSSINLLEYLVQQVQKNSVSLLDLNDELSHLEAASRGKFDGSDLKRLLDGCCWSDSLDSRQFRLQMSPIPSKHWLMGWIK